MKNAALLTIICLVVLTGFTPKTDSKSNIGYINSNELLESMPERDTAQKELEAFAQSLENDLMQMQQEYQTKIKAFQEKEAEMSKPLRETKIKEIQDLEKRINQFQKDAQRDLDLKETALIQPILDAAQKAIDEVAAEQGIEYVLDSGTGVTLVTPTEGDLMPLVKKKLGIQ
mgnify:CR=1 FL=1|tara:strand:+ start:92 stop:607 length:516 start_codon:yes stop_codon:yes gene_type:complete